MKTILTLDDDKWVLETLTLALTARGFDVVSAETPEAALKILTNQPIALLLLDLNMPGKNGFEFYGELATALRVPVLFVSGCSRSFSAKSDKFMQLWTSHFTEGMTDILYKPFSIAQLYDKVESLIGESSTVTNETTH